MCVIIRRLPRARGWEGYVRVVGGLAQGEWVGGGYIHVVGGLTHNARLRGARVLDVAVGVG